MKTVLFHAKILNELLFCSEHIKFLNENLLHMNSCCSKIPSLWDYEPRRHTWKLGHREFMVSWFGNPVLHFDFKELETLLKMIYRYMCKIKFFNIIFNF